MAEDVVTIGFKADTSGIESTLSALDQLAAKGDAVDQGLATAEASATRAAKSLDTLGKSAKDAGSVGDVGAKAAQAASGLNTVSSAAERGKMGMRSYIDSLSAVGNAAKQAAIHLANGGNTAKAATAEWQRMQASIAQLTDTEQKHIKALFDKAKQLKMTAAEAERYSMTQKGMSAEAQNFAASLSKSIGKMDAATQAKNILAAAAGRLVAAFAAIKVVDMVKDMALLSARYETMGVVMKVAGNNAGYTGAQMNEFAKSLQKTGISMMESRNVLTQMATANIDLAQSTKLARAAQDLAVVGATNSSEAFARMVQGIQTGNTMILRTLGLNMNFEESYKKTAKAIGVSVDALSEQEKVQARVDAVLQASTSYSGIYEQSMTTASKQMASMTRYWEDFKVKAGDLFLPSLTALVEAFTGGMKDANGTLDDMAKNGNVVSISDALLTVLSVALKTIGTVVIEVSTVFRILGTSIGGVIAAIDRLAHADIKGMIYVLKETNNDVINLVNQQDAAISKLWEIADYDPLKDHFGVYGNNWDNMTEAQLIEEKKKEKKLQEAQAAADKMAETRKKFLNNFATDKEKLTNTLAEWKKQIEESGGTFTAADEQRIRNSFARKGGSKAASPEANALQSDYDRLTKLRDEYAQLQANDGEVKKYTQSEADLAVVKARLTQGVDSHGKALTAETRRLMEQRAETLGQAAAQEQVNQKLKDEAAEREKAVKAAQSWQESTRSGNEDLQAQIDNYGKSKIAVEQEMLARMNGAVEMDAQIKIGGQWVKVTKEMVEAQRQHIDLMQQLDFKTWNDGIEQQIAGERAKMELNAQELTLVGSTASQRARITAQRKIELEYTKRISEIDRSNFSEGAKDEARRQAARLRDIEIEQTLQRETLDEWNKTADQINQSLSDALMKGFEDGKSFAKNFRDTLRNMFKTLVLQPVISMAVQPVGNMVTSVMGGLLGNGSGGGGNSAMGLVSNASSIYGLASGSTLNTVAGLAGTMGQGTLFANAASGAGLYGGSALDAYLATNGAFGTAASGAGAAAGGASAAAAGGTGAAASGLSSIASVAGPAAALIAFVVAGKMIMDKLVGADHDPHVSGVASYAGVDDSVAKVIAGSTAYNYATGDLPDRAALIAKLAGYGVTGDLGKYNDQQLSSAISEFRYAENGIPTNNGSGVQRAADGAYAYITYNRDGQKQTTSLAGDGIIDTLLSGDIANRNMGDYYRGAGYVDPSSAGYWFNTPWAQQGTMAQKYSAEMTGQMRALAQAITDPLKSIAQITGANADLKTTLGYAASGTDQSWGELGIYQGGKQLLDWNTAQGREGLAPKYFDSYTQFLRQVFGDTLGALKSLDLPNWAQTEVDAAKQQLADLANDADATAIAQIYSTATQTIGQTITQIKGLIDIMPDLTNATQDSIYSIGQAMGGLQNLGSAWSDYMGNFYSDEERFDLIRKQLTTQLSQFGLSLPDTREAFRALVDVQDLATDEGQKAFTALMGAQGAFAQITPVVDAAAEAVSSFDDILKSLQSTTDKAYQSLNKTLDTQLKAAQSLVSEAKAIYDTAGSAARNLWGQQTDTRAMLAAEGRKFIDDALRAARAIGALPDNAQLQTAINSATGGLNADDYASGADYAAAQLTLAGQLDQLKDVAGGQVDAQQRQIDLLQNQIDLYKRQYDLLRGTDDSIGSIAGYVQAFYDAMQAEKAAQLESATVTATAATNATAGGGDGGAAFGGSAGGVATSAGNAGGTWDESGNRLLFGNNYIDYDTGIRYFYDGSSAPVSNNDSTTAFLLDKWKREALGQAKPVSFFAGGGAFGGGLRIVGEQGPELEMTGPARYLSNAQTRSLLAGGDWTAMAGKLDELIVQTQQLVERAGQSNQHLRRTADAVNGRPEMPMLVESA